MIVSTRLVPKNMKECRDMPGCDNCSMAFWDNCQEVLEYFTEMFEDE